MANIKHLHLAGKPLVVNLDQVVYAEQIGSTIRLLSSGNVTTFLEGGTMEDTARMWAHLFGEGLPRFVLD